jgi:hypothetical protein
MHKIAKRVLILVSSLGAAMPLYGGTITESFSTMPVGTCIDAGRVIGSWVFVYDGYGCTAFVSPTGNTILLEQPAVSTQPYETHGSLVLGPATTGDVTCKWTWRRHASCALEAHQIRGKLAGCCGTTPTISTSTT